MNLSEFLKSLSSVSNAGKESQVRDVIKGFDLPRHGLTPEFIIQTLTPENRKDERHLAINKVLGLNSDDRNKDITSAGYALQSPCFNSIRLIKNQFKKWRFPRAYNKGIEKNVDIYPYWVTLEFLVKFAKPISELEFLVFVTTLKCRGDISFHCKMLDELRSSGRDLSKMQGHELPNKIEEKYIKSAWTALFYKLQFFEHIFYDDMTQTISLNNSIEKIKLKHQIDEFYHLYSFPEYENDKTNYLNFLYSVNDESSEMFPQEKEITSDIIYESGHKLINNFPYKNMLLKGVPGTGKSRFIEEIIDNNLFRLKANTVEHECLRVNEIKQRNVLRVNIHSSTNNSELMQGIAVNTNAVGQIEYTEKQGLLLKHIMNAILQPSLPFVIVLEEVQENNLNRLIGDLIFLIEDNRRVAFTTDYPDKTNHDVKFVSDLTQRYAGMNKVNLPSLIQDENEIILCVPNNLYIFCTSNYRDDKKIMEDNLLRRFEVIEIYPTNDAISNPQIQTFFNNLNENIEIHFTELNELHPDRFLTGHAIWLSVHDGKSFARALAKLVVDFKDIKEVAWEELQIILQKTLFTDGELDGYSYTTLTQELQDYYFFEKVEEGQIVSKLEALFLVNEGSAV